MKVRLNLTIDGQLLTEVKKFAKKNETSVSELAEPFFKKMLKPANQNSIVDLVEKLEKPVIKPGADLTELYYREQGKKYGF